MSIARPSQRNSPQPQLTRVSLKRAGKFVGPLQGHHAFDSDLHKALEGAVYSLQHFADPQLRQRVDAILDRILAAQQKDGFLISYFIVQQQDQRWEDLRLEHQMCNAGHFCALRFLEYKLSDIKAVVAAEPLAKLQGVTIVLDLTRGKLRSMQYHPSAGWLKANGYATNLAKCVHIPEAADLPTPRSITEQPWVVLHELAHAYHDQMLDFEEPRILKAYEDFKRSGRGDRALLYDGSRVRHYGLTDQKEFFAEMTESYFGVDDFFPFNRAELMTAEPEIYKLMQAIWGPVAGKGR